MEPTLKLLIWYFVFFNDVIKIWCEFYIYSISQFRLATLQVLSSHMYLVAIMLDSTEIEHFHHFTKFYWTALIWSDASEPRMILLPRKHLALSGDIFNYHNWRGGDWGIGGEGKKKHHTRSWMWQDFFHRKNHVLLGPDFVHVRDISTLSSVKRLEVLFLFSYKCFCRCVGLL